MNGRVTWSYGEQYKLWMLSIVRAEINRALVENRAPLAEVLGSLKYGLLSAVEQVDRELLTADNRKAPVNLFMEFVLRR